MLFVVRLTDGSERIVEAASVRLDGNLGKYVFVAEDKTEDQFLAATEVVGMFRRTPLEPDAATRSRIDRLDSHIKFEFELTSQRLTYLAIAESFLFGSFAAALSVSSGDETKPLPFPKSLNSLLHAVPWIGIILAVVVFAAVIAAVSMIFKLKAVREKLEGDSLGVHHSAGWKSVEHFAGLLPPIVIPACFFVAWLCVWPAK